MTIFSKLDIILSISSLETDNIDNNYSIAPIQKSEYLSRKGVLINWTLASSEVIEFKEIIEFKAVCLFAEYSAKRVMAIARY